MLRHAEIAEDSIAITLSQHKYRRLMTRCPNDGNFSSTVYRFYFLFKCNAMAEAFVDHFGMVMNDFLISKTPCLTDP